MKKAKDSNQKIQQSHKRALRMAKRKKAYHIVKLELNKEFLKNER